MLLQRTGVLLTRFFEQKPRGFYVDVGAHHPIRFRTPTSFTVRDGGAMNIDAMPGSMQEFDKLRPEDRNLEALISSERRRLELFLFNEGALNTCDPELARQR